jgi:hypothetical protein
LLNRIEHIVKATQAAAGSTAQGERITYPPENPTLL